MQVETAGGPARTRPRAAQASMRTRTAQDKLVRVVRGAIWDVAADSTQRVSPTLRPARGGGLTEGTEVPYKISDYAPGSEAGLLWDYPELGID